MIILAVYYTLADVVLLGQCFYYRGFNISEELSSSPVEESDLAAADVSDRAENNAQTAATERSNLLPKFSQVHYQAAVGNGSQDHSEPFSSSTVSQQRRHSVSSFREVLYSHVDGTHLSPATPFVEPESDEARSRRLRRHISTLQTILFNTVAVALVCAAGVLGWYFSPKSKNSTPEPEPLTMDPLGQVFGYLCAAFYLGSRLPQLLLNYRRKSTDGVSLLFFLFACIGNLTYVLSIMAYSPVCRGTPTAPDGVSASLHRHHVKCRPGEALALYGRYILVNLSWLIGSFGTLLLDMAIFVQFFLYQDEKTEDDMDQE